MNKFSVCSEKFVFDFKENVVISKETGEVLTIQSDPLKATEAIGAYIQLKEAVSSGMFGEDNLTEGIDTCVENAVEELNNPVEDPWQKFLRMLDEACEEED